MSKFDTKYTAESSRNYSPEEGGSILSKSEYPSLVKVESLQEYMRYN